MKREYLLAGGAVIVWGTGPAVMKALVASIPAMEVLFLDMLTAAAFSRLSRWERGNGGLRGCTRRGYILKWRDWDFLGFLFIRRSTAGE